MRRWLRKHWIALLGLLPLIPASFKGVIALITWGGDIDFVVSRSQDPGWVGQMINWLIDPPGWAILPLLSLGLACIFLDSRRRLAGMFADYTANQSYRTVKWLKPEAAIDAFVKTELVEERNKNKESAERFAILQIDTESNIRDLEQKLLKGEDVSKRLDTERARHRMSDTGLRVSHDILRASWTKLRREIGDQLESGDLVAKGFLYPHSGGAEEVIISAHEWRVLEISPLEGTAVDKSDGSIKYIGVLIGKRT
jgi:hypothetical protein